MECLTHPQLLLLTTQDRKKYDHYGFPRNLIAITKSRKTKRRNKIVRVSRRRNRK